MKIIARVLLSLSTVAVLVPAAVAPLAAQANYESLAWTPDGTALSVSIHGDLYVLPLDGGPALQLTTAPSREVAAAWSPDGVAVAFSSDRDGQADIFVAGASGANVRPLTSNSHRDSWPSWSPDGERIAFMRNDGERWQLWLMAADGTGQRQLMPGSGNDFNPRWSPDGEWIAFDTDRHGGDQDEIYLVRSDGTGELRLTETPGNDIYPEWSADGSRIAYCTIEDGRAFVHTVLSRGGDSRLLAEDACSPVWSPDGSQIAFVGVRRGQPQQLWVANADGSGRRPVPGPADRAVRAPVGEADASPLLSDATKPNVAILIYDGVQIIDHAAPWEVLGQYGLNNVYTVAKDTTPVTTFMGMRVIPSYGFADHPRPDVVVIPGGSAGDARADPEIIDWVARHAAMSRHVLGICSGVGLLAEAELLAARAATTFYDLLDDLADHPSEIRVVDDRLVVEDGKFITTTGTGIEAALRVVELLHGKPWARVVSLNMEFEALPDDERTSRASLADMNLPRSVYGAFPWRSAELNRYAGDADEWTMSWRFTGPAVDVVARDLERRLVAEGWRPVSTPVVSADAWLSQWAVTGWRGDNWRGTVNLERAEEGQLVLTIEVERR